MSVTTLSSSDDLESAVKQGKLSVVWIFDSDGANRGFGKQYEEWIAGEVKEASFFKAGTDDVKEAMKRHGLAPDNISFFKNGEMVQEEREDHNLIYNVAKSLA